MDIKSKILQKIFSSFLIIVFFMTNLIGPGYGQGITKLFGVGTMLKPTSAIFPPILKGIKINPDNPFRFDFILDLGESDLSDEQIRQESTRLIKYFLAALTIPENDLWVNLSPYEKNRIMPSQFSQTDMGRDLLAQDYILKQLTASLMHPENKAGSDFWEKVKEMIIVPNGTSSEQKTALSKVWIIPEIAKMYESSGTAVILDSHLKVMLEKDYLATKEENIEGQSEVNEIYENTMQELMKKEILPSIEKEVNAGQHFTQLRQIYNSVILAAWFKKRLKESVLGQSYVDKQKIEGIDVNDPNFKDKLYSQYLEAFRKGVYDYIREEYSQETQEIVSKRYFSGGTELNVLEKITFENNPDFAMVAFARPDRMRWITSAFEPTNKMGDASAMEGANSEEKKSPSAFIEDQGRAIRLKQWNEFFKDDSQNAPTPRLETGDKNKFIDFNSRNTEKTREEILGDLDAAVFKEHFRLQRTYGFIHRNDSAQAETIHKIFDRLVIAYNKQADMLGQPQFQGKLFIVDSPNVNAFVFSEHSDVYIHAGLIRELANFAELTGSQFSEDVIAAVLAHEMTHVLQHSSYEGLDWEQIAKNNRKEHEFLELKRKAEYHADEGSMTLLSFADYNPEAILSILMFLQKKTKKTTTELGISTHPHPKDRLAYIETLIEDELKVFPNWKKRQVVLDTVAYKALGKKHVGDKIQHVKSLEDVRKQITEAKSMEEVVALIKLAKELEKGLYAVRFANSSTNKKDLAKRLYIYNLIEAMREIFLREQGDNSIFLPHSMAPEQGNAPLAKEMFLMRMTENDNQEVPDLKLADQKPGYRIAYNIGKDKYEDILNILSGRMIKRVLDSTLSSDQKIRLVGLMKSILDLGLAVLSEAYLNNSESLDTFTRATPDPELFKQIVDQVQKGDLTYLSKFKSIPFAMFMVYGKDSLSEEVDPSDYKKRMEDLLGKEMGDLEIGKIFLEREMFGFYQKDARLLDINEQGQKDKLWRALLIENFLLSAEALTRQSDGQLGDYSERFFTPGLEDAIYESVKRVAPNYKDGTDADIFALNERLKRDLAAYLSGRNPNPDNKRELNIYFQNVVSGQGNFSIFSDIFEAEYRPRIESVSLFDKLTHKEITHESAQWMEENMSSDNVAVIIHDQFVAIRSKGGITEEQEVDYLRKTLSLFSVFFRTELIEELIGQSKKGRFYFGPKLIIPLRFNAWFKVLKGLIHPADMYRMILKAVDQIDSDKQENVAWINQSASLENIKDDLQVIDWIIDNKPESEGALSKNVLGYYFKLRVKAMELEVLAGMGKNHLSFLTPAEVKRRDQIVNEKYLSPDQVYELVLRMAKVGQLEFKYLNRMASSSTDANDVRNGVVKEEVYDLIMRENKRFKFSFKDVGITFFNKPSSDSEVELFLNIFNFNDEQLKEIAMAQEEFRNKESLNLGRFSADYGQTNFQSLLDVILIRRVMFRVGLTPDIITREKLSGIGSFRLDKSGNYESGEYLEFVELKYDHEIPEIANEIIYAMKLEGGDGFDIAVQFFEELAKSGFIGRSWELDWFFTRFERSPDGIKLFPYYAQFMEERQIPGYRRGKMQPSSERRGYLEALAASVDLEGTKARVFKKYDAAHSHLLKSDRPVQYRIKDLTILFKKATAFRDGFIDKWEQEIVPEMKPSWLEQKGIAYITKQKEKGFINDEYGEFETMVMVGPLQWQKLKDEPLKIEDSSRVRRILSFYAETIPLVFDPERQVRMGLTALKILKVNLPDISFLEEFEAIKKFMPFASESRDQELQGLLDRHTIPDLDAGVTEVALAEVMSLFKSQGDMEYDEELTNANMAGSTMKSILASASRGDRMDLLFWILDPEHNPKPSVINELDNKFNIDFGDMPYHVSFLPKEYRVKVLQSLFLGENGLFSPQTSSDVELMDKLVDKLFLYFFPAPDDKEGIKRFNNQKRDLSPEVYNMIREIFPVVMREYSPARRSSIAMSLLSIYDKLSNMSEGQRLAELLGALGPVGVKIGQYLSENKNLIPNNALRSDLGSLKGRASPISKLAVLETLKMEGFDISKIRIGRRLGSASMKQVHEGWYEIEPGNWVEVVIKVLRPKIERTVRKDIDVLRKVVQFIKEKYGKDGGDIAQTIESWIARESDFRLEGQNVAVMNQAIEMYYKAHPEESDEEPVATPKVFVGDRVKIMIEEKVRGIEVGRLFSTEDNWERSPESVKELRADLKKRGFSEEEIVKVLSVKRADMVDKLRRMLLYMIFGIGKFHADLHSDNTMKSPGKTYLIDMGLIREINERQILGAQNIMKGVMLHDADLLFEGIRAMHVESEEVKPEEKDALVLRIEEMKRKIIKNIKSVFRKKQNIKSEFNDIMTIVLQEKFGKSSDDFSTFMKAFTQAIWLFPTEINNGLTTLRALSEQLQMSKYEYRKAAFTHALPIAKKALGMTWVRWKTRLGEKWERRINPWRDRWLKMKNQIKGVKMLKTAQDAAETIDEVFTEVLKAQKDKTTVANWLRNQSATVQIVRRSGYITAEGKFEQVHPESRISGKIGTMAIELDEGALNKIPAYVGASESEKVGIRTSIDIFLKVQYTLNRYMFAGYSPNFNLSLYENKILEGASSMEFGQELMINDILARIITSRIIKQRIKDGQWQGKYIDILSPQHPGLRFYSELWVEQYFEQLQNENKEYGLDREKGDKIVSQLLSLDEEILKLEISSRDVIGEIKVSTSVSGDNVAVSMKRKFNVVVDGNQFPEVLKVLRSKQKDLTPTSDFITSVDDRYYVMANRTGYTEKGRFIINVWDIFANVWTRFTLTLDEFKGFVRGKNTKADFKEVWIAKKSKKSEIASLDLSNFVLKVKTPAVGPAVEQKDEAYERIMREIEAIENEGAQTLSGEENLDAIGENITDSGTADESMLSANKGGIDFNSKYLNFKTEPVSKSDHSFTKSNVRNIKINGLKPVILKISPVTNVPLILGQKPKVSSEELSLVK